jgi:RHS repeat-associated protein
MRSSRMGYRYDAGSSSMMWFRVCAFAYKFTGKERDTESGLDYFGARYYASSMGRFMSPDPSGLYYADQTNPQSFNLYAYALNNPLKFIDPTGLTICNWGHSDNNTGAADGNDYDDDEDCVKDGGKLVQNFDTVNVNPDNSGNSEQDMVNAGVTTILQYQTWSGNPYLQWQPGQLSSYALGIIQGVNQQLAWVPTVCAYTISASVSGGPVSVALNSTQKGSSMSVSGSAALSNYVRTNVGINLGSQAPAASVRIGTPFVGIALNPTSGQIGGYVGSQFGIGKLRLGARITNTVGKTRTNVGRPVNTDPCAGH